MTHECGAKLVCSFGNLKKNKKSYFSQSISYGTDEPSCFPTR